MTPQTGHTLLPLEQLTAWCDSLASVDAPAGAAQGRSQSEQTSAAGAADRLLELAAKVGATDLHLEPSPDRLAVRVRIDGVLASAGFIPAPLAGRIVTRLKVMANLLTYRHDIPQEGRIEAACGRGEMRLAVFPVLAGERAMVRLFSPQVAGLSLDGLGLPPEAVANLARLAGRGDGMILLTGPAGSGKTTTIYALLRHIVTAWPGRSVLSLEDPVEQVIEGVSQSQVGGPGGLGFADGLRSALRQDPQVLVVGEIRDAATATTAIQAALTGHLLISTIHAGSAAAVFARLLQIGIEPFQLASSVTAVLAQRLPRRLCRSCRGTGCESCGRSGYAGRVLLSELLLVGEQTREAVMARAPLAGLQAAARGDAMVSMDESARRLTAAGITTDSELDRVGT